MPTTLLVAALLSLVSVQAVVATTYEPVTFSELVTRADMIFAGEVMDVRPYAESTARGRVIRTRVVFRVTDPMTAGVGTLEVLEFLGGEIDGVAMAVAEMPRFVVGDRRVVFARRQRSINPIVGFTQGLLRVVTDASGVQRVLTHDGQPLTGTAVIGTRQAAQPQTAAVAMRLSDLRNQIVRTLPQARRR